MLLSMVMTGAAGNGFKRVRGGALPTRPSGSQRASKPTLGVQGFGE